MLALSLFIISTCLLTTFPAAAKKVTVCLCSPSAFSLILLPFLRLLPVALVRGLRSIFPAFMRYKTIVLQCLYAHPDSCLGSGVCLDTESLADSVAFFICIYGDGQVCLTRHQHITICQ